jgi:hypothetical protein
LRAPPPPYITEKHKILAYNADYHFHIIRSECRRHGLHPGHLGDRSHWDCVMSRRSNWLRIQRWMPLDGGHRALDDCLSALDVLRSLTAPPCCDRQHDDANGPTTPASAPVRQALRQLGDAAK